MRFFAEILSGIARAILLVSHIGESRSCRIGVFTGSLIILGIASLTVRWINASRASPLPGVEGLRLALTVAFEILFGRFVVGAAWERLAQMDRRVLRKDLSSPLFFLPA